MRRIYHIPCIWTCLSLLCATEQYGYSPFEEGCGDGYTCSIDDVHGYGCEAISNSTGLVCCSAGQPQSKWCVDCSDTNSTKPPCNLQPGQLPYCPANGATGSGCVRLESIKQLDIVIDGEECGDGYMCSHDDHHGYGCANSTDMVCCSEGQGCDEPGQECGKWCVDCSASKGPCHLQAGQLPYCPANGATGPGCVRKEHGQN